MSPDVSKILEAAQRSDAAGKLTDVERLCNQALSLEPGCFRANMLLGQALAKSGRIPAAATALKKAVELDPTSFEAIIWLVPLLKKLGNLALASSYAEQAVQLQPLDAAGHSLLGECLFALGDTARALFSLERAVELEPTAAVLHHQLAQGLAAAGREPEAIREFRHAIELDPAVIHSYISLGQLLASQGDKRGAASIYRQAHTLEPQTSRGLLQLARALLEEGDANRAEEILRKTITLDPNSYASFVLLGSTLRQLGRFEEAIASLEQSIVLRPRLAQGYCDIAFCKRFDESDRDRIDKMLELAVVPSLGAQERSRLEYALGKVYDDLGDYSSAMTHFDEANRLAKNRNRMGLSSDSAARTPPLMSLPQKTLESLASEGYESDLPVFVVGMIRSGTTLIERMLSSHPEVSGVGELDFWGRNVERDGKDDAELLESGFLNQLGESYCRLLESLTPKSRHVVDKMPTNFRRLGSIHAALPNARIIHVRRHPVDTCLSIYVTPNRANLPFLHDRGKIVAEYRSYLQIMEHWRKVLPASRFIEIDYEQVAAHPEAAARHLLDFLGLDWDSRCLQPELNPDAVSTPSQWQVRQPIYKSSIGRWRNYEPVLGEFNSLL